MHAMKNIKLITVLSEVILSWSYGEVYSGNLFDVKPIKVVCFGLKCLVQLISL